MEFKDFSKSEVSKERPYLLNVQREAWEDFWDSGLDEMFDEVFPIKDHTGEKMELQYMGYKLGKPEYDNYMEANEHNASYEAPLRIKVKLVDLQSNRSKKEEIFLTDFPLMTQRGTFLINGVERVIISQLIRSPGVFFNKEVKKGEDYFGAKIIPKRGAWLEFATDLSGRIGVKVNRKRKVAATTLLRAFGYGTNEKIEDLFEEVDTGETNYIEETIKKDPAANEKEGAVEIYKRLRPGDRAAPDTAYELIEDTFFNFDRYDLSRVGRWKIRERLPSRRKQKGEWDRDKEVEISKGERLLKPEDVVATMKEIIRLNNTEDAEPDKIDHLGNRRIRNANELFQDRLRVGLTRMERIIQDRMASADEFDPNKLINPKPFRSRVQQFFTSGAISQFMDEENPLAELEHKRRMTATGPGGLTKERAGFEVRDVQPSHYGRICPIQTPEGSNIGLTTHLASYAQVNSLGFLETPYFKVKNGKITDEVEYLDGVEEEQYNIAHGGVEMEDGEIQSEMVECRSHGEPAFVEKEEIDFIDVSSEQFLSVAASLVPFLQNTDGNRALMGANMQRQGVPLIKPEMPLVQTGMEQKVARDSGLTILAQASGEVVEVDADKIKIKTDDDTNSYTLKTFARSNQRTCFHQKPIVEKGQEVEEGEVLASGAAVDHDRLALGKNIMVAFMPWRGINFEDAIIISERLVKDDVFTSIHIENFECDVRETKLGPEVTTYDIPNVGEDKLKDLDEEGIVQIGAEVEPNDILVGKISPKGESGLTAEERLLRAIFGEKAKEVKDTSLRMEHGKRGRVVGVKTFSREEGDDLDAGIIKKVEVEVAQKRKIKVGDKLAGRHGNKGVIAKILPREEMPFMEDGTPVDIILNPLGVVSRMNLGQVLETHLAYAAKKQGYKAVTPALSGAVEEDIKEELSQAGLPEDGKIDLYDGRTGEKFPKKVTVGYIYMMKLIHMIDDKNHARAIGPYSLITQQPLGGKAQFGGQRFGEMEVWALEGYGAAHSLQEMLTLKSDDVEGRRNAYEAVLRDKEMPKPNVPASFNLLVRELKGLGLEVNLDNEE